MLENDIIKVLVSEEEIKEICIRLGKIITEDYKDKKPLIVGLLKGCAPFMAELTKHIDCYVQLDYMGVSSYHGGTESTGDVKINSDLSMSVRGRNVLIAEDIVDTGITLKEVVKLLEHRGAESVEVVTLLDKPSGRKVEFTPKYVGTKIPAEFVVGFGLDYDEYYRNLPYIGVLKPEIYTK